MLVIAFFRKQATLFIVACVAVFVNARVPYDESSSLNNIYEANRYFLDLPDADKKYLQNLEEHQKKFRGVQSTILLNSTHTKRGQLEALKEVFKSTFNNSFTNLSTDQQKRLERGFKLIKKSFIDSTNSEIKDVKKKHKKAATFILDRENYSYDYTDGFRFENKFSFRPLDVYLDTLSYKQLMSLKKENASEEEKKLKDEVLKVWDKFLSTIDFKQIIDKYSGFSSEEMDCLRNILKNPFLPENIQLKLHQLYEDFVLNCIKDGSIYPSKGNGYFVPAVYQFGVSDITFRTIIRSYERFNKTDSFQAIKVKLLSKYNLDEDKIKLKDDQNKEIDDLDDDLELEDKENEKDEPVFDVYKSNTKVIEQIIDFGESIKDGSVFNQVKFDGSVQSFFAGLAQSWNKAKKEQNILKLFFFSTVWVIFLPFSSLDYFVIAPIFR